MANRQQLILVGTVAAIISAVLFVAFSVMVDNNGGFAFKPNTRIDQLDKLEIHDLEPVINVTRRGDES